MPRRSVIAAAVLLGALALGGCSRHVIEVEHIDGLPDGVTVPVVNDGAPMAFASDDRLQIVTWGSSSCRPELVDLTAEVDPPKIAFTTPRGSCTDDLAPTTFVLSAVEFGGTVPSRVVIEIDGTRSTVDVRD
ncbi:hypothetical protein [Microbacterium sp.]|uniref:hypothetical protein n=1 Tax=Microbacterium sp. TaxID=51671 RepID=UPI003A8E52BF